MYVQTATCRCDPIHSFTPVTVTDGRVGDGEPGLTGYRGTWGLPRLVFPAVVAYVVRMYRVRARLFATPTWFDS